jgi:hypothetical protein
MPNFINMLYRNLSKFIETYRKYRNFKYLDINLLIYLNQYLKNFKIITFRCATIANRQQIYFV